MGLSLELIARIESPTGETAANFGYSLDLSGNRLIVGNTGEGYPYAVGAAYVYNTDNITQPLRLAPETPQYRSDFGEAVAVNDRYALVGASRYGDKRQSPDNSWGPGSAFLFDVVTGEQLFEFSSPLSPGFPFPDPEAVHYRFGQEVALTDKYAIVSAPSGLNGGAVYVYDLETRAEVHVFTGELHGKFGSGISVEDNRLLVGSPGQYQDRPDEAAYLFSLDSGELLQRFDPFFSDQDEDFGATVALVGGNVAIGRHGDHYGFVYTYDADTGTPGHYIVPDRGPSGYVNVWHFGEWIEPVDDYLVIGSRSYRSLQVFDQSTGSHVESFEIILDGENRAIQSMLIEDNLLAVGVHQRKVSPTVPDVVLLYRIVPEPNTIALVVGAIVALLAMRWDYGSQRRQYGAS